MPYDRKLLDSIENDLVGIRRDVRVWSAIGRAPIEPWFGGSQELMDTCRLALTHMIVMTIRKLLDKGKLSKGGGPEDGLYNLYVALYRADLTHVANELYDLPSARHLRLAADKNLAHAKLDQASERSPHAPEFTSEGIPLTAADIPVRMVVEVVDAMSKAYLLHFSPECNLDNHHLKDDVLYRHIPPAGLPGIDYPSDSVFQAQSTLRTQKAPPPARFLPPSR